MAEMNADERRQAWEDKIAYDQVKLTASIASLAVKNSPASLTVPTTRLWGAAAVKSAKSVIKVEQKVLTKEEEWLAAYEKRVMHTPYAGVYDFDQLVFAIEQRIDDRNRRDHSINLAASTSAALKSCADLLAGYGGLDYLEYAVYDLAKCSRIRLPQSNDKIELVLVCWEPGQETSDHDGRDGCANNDCLMTVIEGELQEFTFSSAPTSTTGATGVQSQFYKQRNIQEGLVVFNSASSGDVHKLRNRPNDRSVSLHVYVNNNLPVSVPTNSTDSTLTLSSTISASAGVSGSTPKTLDSEPSWWWKRIATIVTLTNKFPPSTITNFLLHSIFFTKLSQTLNFKILKSFANLLVAAEISSVDFENFSNVSIATEISQSESKISPTKICGNCKILKTSSADKKIFVHVQSKLRAWGKKFQFGTQKKLGVKYFIRIWNNLGQTSYLPSNIFQSVL